MSVSIHERCVHGMCRCHLFFCFMSSAQLPFPVLGAWSVFGYMCGTLFASTYSLYAEYLPWKMLPALIVVVLCEVLTRWTPPPFERQLSARLQYGLSATERVEPRTPMSQVTQQVRRFLLLCVRRAWRLIRVYRLAFMFGMFVEAFKVGS